MLSLPAKKARSTLGGGESGLGDLELQQSSFTRAGLPEKASFRCHQERGSSRAAR
jgi:hypothetical protein